MLSNINNMASNVATNLVTQQTTSGQTQPVANQPQQIVGQQQATATDASIATMNPTEAFVAGANAVAQSSLANQAQNQSIAETTALALQQQLGVGDWRAERKIRRFREIVGDRRAARGNREIVASALTRRAE